MRQISVRSVVLVSLLALAGAAEAAQNPATKHLAAKPPAPLPPLTEAVKPSRLAGAGLYVVDIEKVRAFYVDVLGLKVVQRIPAQGAVREYLLSFQGEAADGPVLVLTKTAKPTAKPADYGRIIFAVPDGAALARRAAQAGYPPIRIVEGTNIITDPEGHKIELFQRAATPAAK
jgi:catechol 2,3-dioxygenase-like lactoylglutathione lyase family enzyme